jgi:hypothetical protein
MNCSENYEIEKKQGVLNYCPHSEHAEWIAEGLRAIAELRSTTTVLVKQACENHSSVGATNAIEKWNEAKKRVQEERDKKMIQFPRHHVMGDALEGCFDELNS